MDINVMAKTTFPPLTGGIIFVLAVLGFGIKAGFIPLHIWLPHAHPAAPAPISALLSGALALLNNDNRIKFPWIAPPYLQLFKIETP